MGKSIIDETLPEPRAEYYPEEGILYVDNGKPFGDGETIAKGLVVFYDRGERERGGWTVHRV